jgi:gas vesicle protein
MDATDDRTGDCASHGASYSALTFSFLAGGIAGATAALLLAPQSGKVTRQMVGRKLNDTAGSARELKGRAIRRGQEFREEATHRVEGAASALAGKASPKEHGEGARQ